MKFKKDLTNSDKQKHLKLSIEYLFSAIIELEKSGDEDHVLDNKNKLKSIYYSLKYD